MEILLTFGKYGKSAKLKGRNDGNAEMAEISIKYGNRKRWLVKRWLSTEMVSQDG